MGSRMFCDADVYKSIGDTLAWVCMNNFIRDAGHGLFSFFLFVIARVHHIQRSAADNGIRLGDLPTVQDTFGVGRVQQYHSRLEY